MLLMLYIEKYRDISMVKYEGQLKEVKYKTIRSKRKKIYVKRCTDIFTFDIEVSSAWMKDGELIPYTPGQPVDYWNDKKSYSLPYIWQFSFNDQVYYGREIEKFKEVLQDIPDDMDVCFYVHNLAYEICFLINFLTVEHIFARSAHKPMYVTFKEFPRITFKCSYVLTNLSLESWGKQLRCLKLTGDLDYRTLRTPLTPLTDAELAYCERDCIVVYEGIKDHLKQYKNVWDIPLTSTGKVRRPVKKLVTNDKDYMRDMKKLIPEDADQYHMFQNLFAGGYTHGNRKYLDKVISGEVMEHVDIASSYPTCMLAYKYPYNKWCYISKHMPDPKTFEYRAYIIKLHFTGLKCISWNSYISGAKSRGRGMIYDNGRVLYADELFITVTEQDYITIMNNYTWESVESEGTWVCHKRYLPTIFMEYLLKLYEDKTSLKGVDLERYGIAKQYINSMYGMCVTSLFNQEIRFNQEDGSWTPEELTKDQVNAGLEKMRRWFDKKYFLSYPVGCWITAYARRRLWMCVERIDKDLLYTDTDSLFYKGHKNWKWFNDDIDKKLRDACDYHGFDFERTRPADVKGVKHPLGYLEREDEDQTIEAFKTLGAKKYCEQRDGKLYLTVAGINKAAVECLDGDINNFQDGFVFDKDAESVKKLELTYLTDMNPVTWPDGYRSELKFGLTMRPTGYKLSVPKVIDVLDVLYNYVCNPEEQESIRKRGIFS